MEATRSLENGRINLGHALQTVLDAAVERVRAAGEAPEQHPVVLALRTALAAHKAERLNAAVELAHAELEDALNVQRVSLVQRALEAEQQWWASKGEVRLCLCGRTSPYSRETADDNCACGRPVRDGSIRMGLREEG